jgi:RNA polymerase sigma-70 factor (ECF subfamily)
MSEQTEREPIGFAATQWSLVERAGQATVQTRKASLSTLLQRYLPALRAHLRIDKRFPAQIVEDLLQGFVADKIVEQNLIGHADPAKGKFRSFLLVSLNRYVVDQLRREGSAKRLGSGVALPEGMDQEHFTSREAGPSEQFDIAWARELVAQALRQMRDECQTLGRPEIWGVFECRIVRPAFDGIEATPYEELIEKFALETPLAAYNLLTTGKRMFTRMLRWVAAEYAEDETLADQEIDDLKSVLSRIGA